MMIRRARNGLHAGRNGQHAECPKADFQSPAEVPPHVAPGHWQHLVHFEDKRACGDARDACGDARDVCGDARDAQEPLVMAANDALIIWAVPSRVQAQVEVDVHVVQEIHARDPTHCDAVVATVACRVVNVHLQNSWTHGSEIHMPRAGLLVTPAAGAERHGVKRRALLRRSRRRRRLLPQARA